MRGAWLVVGVVTASSAVAVAQPPGMSTGAPPPESYPSTVPSELPERRFAVGYQRGLGHGWFGAGGSALISPRWTVHVNAFALTGEATSGFAIAPLLQFSRHARKRISPYIAGGPYYVRASFGDASGHTFGWCWSVGVEWRSKSGLGIQAGWGTHSRRDLMATDGIVTVTQQGAFGLHWDLGVRWWF